MRYYCNDSIVVAFKKPGCVEQAFTLAYSTHSATHNVRSTCDFKYMCWAKYTEAELSIPVFKVFVFNAAKTRFPQQQLLGNEIVSDLGELRNTCVF